MRQVRASGAAALMAALAAVAAWAGLGGCGERGGSVESSDPAEREAALRHLAEEGSDEALDRIQDVLTRGDTGTAVRAVRALNRVQRPRARRMLVSVIDGDQRAPVRRAAIESVGLRPKSLVQQAEVDALRRAAARDPDPKARRDAAGALGIIGNLRDVDLLVQIATREDNLEVQTRAVRAIEELIDVRFRYDPNAPEEERAEALERVRKYAPAVARKYMNHPQGRDLP